MAVTRTAKGTYADKSSPITCPWTAIASMSVAGGASLIVGHGGRQGTSIGSPQTMSWNSNSMNKDIDRNGANALYQGILFAYHNATGGTGNLVLDTTGTEPDSAAGCAVQLEGLDTAPLDKTAAGAADSNTVDSGNTATTSQADEYLAGFLWYQEDDVTLPDGTNDGDCTTNGQNVKSTGGGAGTLETSMTEYYATVSATGTYNHAVSSLSQSRQIIAMIATYTIASAATRDHRGNNPMQSLPLLPLLPALWLARLGSRIGEKMDRRRFLKGGI